MHVGKPNQEASFHCDVNISMENMCIYSTPAIYRGIKKPLHQPTQHTCRCRKGESVHQPIIVQDILAGCTFLRIYISSDTPQSKFASYAYAQDMQRMHERTHSTTSHHGQIHV